MMIRYVPTWVSALMLASIALLGCSGSEGGAQANEEQAGVDVQETPATADAPDDALSPVEQVFADIAAMELTSEERLGYLYERAQEEGEVLVYGDLNVETQEAWSEGFQSAYPGVDQGFVRLQNTDLLERVLAEARAGRQFADVVQITASVASQLLDEGLVVRHHNVPVPDRYPLGHVDDHSMTILITPQIIAWNTNLIAPEDAPRELDDFLEPEHSGCLFSGAPTWISTMIVERGYDATEQWLQGFVENGGIALRGSSSAAAQALAAGEYACLVQSNVHLIEPLKADDGAPVEWHAPASTPVTVAQIYIHRDTPRPHAAALFAHWVVSAEGGQLLSEDGRIPLHPDVDLRYERLRPFTEPGTDLADRLRILTPEEFDRSAEQSLELLDRYVTSEGDAS